MHFFSSKIETIIITTYLDWQYAQKYHLLKIVKDVEYMFQVFM